MSGISFEEAAKAWAEQLLRAQAAEQRVKELEFRVAELETELKKLRETSGNRQD